MTLITTHISRFGIINGTDSNLTENDADAGRGQKLFPVPSLNAALSVAGTYSVGGMEMDAWLSSFIDEATSNKEMTLATFSQLLGKRLQAEMTASEKSRCSLIHASGYVEVDGRSHPEFWFIRNVSGVDEITGACEGCGDEFVVEEQFWQRDFKNGDFDVLSKGWAVFYFNGYAPGRIAYLALNKDLDKFFKGVWNNSNWKFRPARSIRPLA